MSTSTPSIVLSVTGGPDRCGVIVAGFRHAAQVASFLVERSAAFEVIPLPDDEYRIAYKPVNHKAVLERFDRPVDRPDEKPWSIERELTPDGVRAETEGKGGVEIHAGGYCQGVWVDHEHDGYSPRMTRMLHRANCFGPLLKAAETLLESARDMGDCFVDKDHEKYDPSNPEQMWTDWAALREAVDNCQRGEPHAD